MKPAVSLGKVSRGPEGFSEEEALCREKATVLFTSYCRSELGVFL